MASRNGHPDEIGRASIDLVSGCVFCRIVTGIDAAEVIHADEFAVAFLDTHPLFHGHTLVVPRRHVVTLAELSPAEVGPLFERVRVISEQLPRALGCQGTFVANNNVVSQSVPHLHVHVVPRTKGDGLRGFFWPRTKYVGTEMFEVGERVRAALADAEF